MTFADVLRKRSIILRWLRDQAKNCETLAKAHVQNGDRWAGGTPVDNFFWRPEYQRARARILRTSGLELVKVVSLRVITLNPELINVTHQLRQVQWCCRSCEQVNQKRLAGGKPFVCLLDAQEHQPFRFHLTEKGEIVERE